MSQIEEVPTAEVTDQARNPRLGQCKLCLNIAELQNSHHTPAFVARWLKATSATGFFRRAVNPNRRVQDFDQSYLLCRQCEERIGNSEKQFASRIFHPYVDLLGKQGILSTNRNFQYGDWLLRFGLSLHWRMLATKENKRPNIPQWQIDLLHKAEECWRQFLVGERDDTGIGETHILFFQNLAAGEGHLPMSIPKNVNLYLLRSVDSTPAVSEKAVFVFSKVGPIGFCTTLEPTSFKSGGTTRVGMRGNVSTVQTIRNKTLTEYVFVSRPTQIQNAIVLSDVQKAKIEHAYKSNPERVSRSMTVQATAGDALIQDRISQTQNSEPKPRKPT